MSYSSDINILSQKWNIFYFIPRHICEPCLKLSIRTNSDLSVGKKRNLTRCWLGWKTGLQFNSVRLFFCRSMCCYSLVYWARQRKNSVHLALTNVSACRTARGCRCERGSLHRVISDQRSTSPNMNATSVTPCRRVCTPLVLPRCDSMWTQSPVA